MPISGKIAILAATPGERQYLEEIVGFLGLDFSQSEEGAEIPTLKIQDGSVVLGGFPSERRTLSLPVAPAELLSFLQSAFVKQRQPIQKISFGAYSLNAHDGMLSSLGKKDMRLTEKEIAILICLHEAGGKTVDRQKLLDTIWGYADSVETHTLETHIYRLRQKIEADPAEPQLLLTQDTGYALFLG